MRSNVDFQKIEQLMEGAIAPEMIRFPSLNSALLRSRVENLIERFEDKGLEE
jgi:hypothetical protein